MTQTKRTDSNNSDARMTRGLALLQSNGKSILENEDGSFALPSQTSNKTYEARILGERFVCTCPDFEYRQIDACKHIHCVKLWIAVRTQLQNEPKPKVFAEDAIPCDGCGSIRTMRYGKSGKKTDLSVRTVTASSENPLYSRRLGLILSLLLYVLIFTFRDYLSER